MYYNEYYVGIEEILDFVYRDLVGPTDEFELISDVTPLSTYVMGILYPQRKDNDTTLGIDELDDEKDGLEDILKIDDDTIANANKYKPSTLAITVMVTNSEKKLRCNFTFGKYNLSVETLDGRKINKYTRTPYEINTDFDIPSKCVSISCNSKDEVSSLGLRIEMRVRKIFADGRKLITVSVTNNDTYHVITEMNTKAIFQSKLELEVTRGFLPLYQNGLVSIEDEDYVINRLLYRNIHNYAYGHGCSTRYFESQSCVYKVVSDFMPVEQVLQIMPRNIQDETVLQMVYWLSVNKKEGCQRLRKFVHEYAQWYESLKIKGEKLEQHQKAVNIVFNNIKKCIERLLKGIDMLESNSDAFRSFTLMNEAMMLQRVKTKKCEETSVFWYPFQLAYILMIIPEIVDENNDYRNIVDLLWFPTGGGKTEAYLGLSAFVIFYRRLTKKLDNDGVTILMRYTLRLLTIQQFERATAMICACEYLRKKYKISNCEINIGLWIGSNMTPNHLEDAKNVISQLKADQNKEIFEGNPVLLTVCPWCGSTLEIGCYNVENILHIRCANNSNCEFHNKLPVYLVDEDIYRIRPTLVLSTIDKFARIVWEENSRALFGVDSVPPDLIIQDELHLISGPLGSIAGLYEIAVEKLCTRGNIKPKIIAFTATVKNARQQIKNLYNRDMFQFPPSGIDLDDSFFAVRASKEQRPARTYVGLCETGGNITDLIIRLYAALFFVSNIFIKTEKPTEVIDQFYTIIGYFNAIKDLGASSSIINDRVGSIMKYLITHKFCKEAIEAGFSANDFSGYLKHDELTSRLSSTKIKKTLERLGMSYPDEACFSYVLASNMLSVGIDINRLGIMTVYNQPKTNSEYIQATSRVGRSKPGIVFTLYNNSRSRDKSYYEQFNFYHKTFYQYVEATSVTPFSARAMQKALHCVFIALVRHLIPDMSGNKAVSRFRSSLDGVAEIKEYIIDRVRQVYPQSEIDAISWLDYIIDCWENLARSNPDTFVYRDSLGKFCLLNSAEKGSYTDFPTVLNALRNVEESSNIYIKARER